jgi:GTP-binding protein
MSMLQATFVGSSTSPKQAPRPQKPAFAFIGRSNVGKSSLINSLLARKKLAQTSSTPGKTQLINYFLVDNAWYLVDLPGYGWAKVSKAKRWQFQKMAKEYLLYNPMVVCALVLVDSRHMPQAIDVEFMNWLGKSQVPFAIVFTKIDKSPLKQVQAHVLALQEIMLKSWESLPKFFMTSATQHKGCGELLAYIQTHISKHAPGLVGSKL